MQCIFTRIYFISTEFTDDTMWLGSVYRWLLTAITCGQIARNGQRSQEWAPMGDPLHPRRHPTRDGDGGPVVRVHPHRAVMDNRICHLSILHVLLSKSHQGIREGGHIQTRSAHDWRGQGSGYDIHSAMHRHLQEDRSSVSQHWFYMRV